MGDANDGKTESPRMDVDPSLFPQERYTPLVRLGTGASGNVYLCHDRVLGKRVAVKTLHLLNAEQLIAFQQEARATSKLSHPNIVTTLDFGATEEGRPYMVMELSSGISLAQYLVKFGTLDEAAAVPLFEKICSALGYAHEKGVFHRDLKPSNLVVFENADGEYDVQVIDFGVAKVKHENQEPTIVQGRTVVGTPAYMSPDQVAGLTYDARSEVYALGCVLFEALTGRVPFIGETAMETLTMQANMPPPVPSEFRDDVSEELDAVVSYCLAKEPEERFQSMRELEAELQRVREKHGQPERRILLGSGELEPGGESSVVRDKSLASRDEPKTLVLPMVLAFAVVVPLLFYFFFQLMTVESDAPPVKAAKRRRSGPLPSAEKDMFDSIDKATNAYTVTQQLSGGVQLVITRKVIEKDVTDIKKVIKDKRVTQLCFNLAELNSELLEPFSTESGLDLLMIDHNKFDEKMLEIISRMRNLRTICIAYSDTLPTAGLAHLKKLKSLNSLILSYSRTQPDAIREIAQIKNLDFLNLAYCPIGRNQGELVNLQMMRALNLRGTGVDDGLVPILPRLKNLASLTVSGNRGITGETLAAVKDKPLRFLSIGSTSIRPEDLIYIRKMPLEVLEVGGLGLDDSSLRYFAGLKALERLSIAHNKFTDKALFRFALMDSLKAVEVSGNPVTEIGINAINAGSREIVTDPREPFPLGDEFSDVQVWNKPSDISE